VLDGYPAPPRQKGHSSPSPLFGRCLWWLNSRPSQLLLSSSPDKPGSAGSTLGPPLIMISCSSSTVPAAFLAGCPLVLKGDLCQIFTYAYLLFSTNQGNQSLQVMPSLSTVADFYHFYDATAPACELMYAILSQF